MSKKPLSCSVCEKTFTQKCFLKEHERIHTGERPFKCDVCGKSFRGNVVLRNHKIIHLEAKTIECDVCGKFFKTKRDLGVHKKYHTQERKYKCGICDKGFINNETLKVHVCNRLVHSVKCNICSKHFSNQESLEIHLSNHPIKEHICDLCDKSLSSKDMLKKHMKTHNKIFSCQICTKTFATKDILNRHLPRHNNTKEFKCHICVNSFRVKLDLVRHLRNHIRPKTELTCKICAKQFQSLGILNSHHKEVHMNERPYKCDVCEKSFNRMYILRRHCLVHTGERPFKCNWCNRCFNQRSLLQLHCIIHTGKKPFECNKCHKSFFRKNSLNHHKCQELNKAKVDRGIHEVSPNNDSCNSKITSRYNIKFTTLNDSLKSTRSTSKGNKKTSPMETLKNIYNFSSDESSVDGDSYSFNIDCKATKGIQEVITHNNSCISKTTSRYSFKSTTLNDSLKSTRRGAIRNRKTSPVETLKNIIFSSDGSNGEGDSNSFKIDFEATKVVQEVSAQNDSLKTTSKNYLKSTTLKGSRKPRKKTAKKVRGTSNRKTLRKMIFHSSDESNEEKGSTFNPNNSEAKKHLQVSNQEDSCISKIPLLGENILKSAVSNNCQKPTKWTLQRIGRTSSLEPLENIDSISSDGRDVNSYQIDIRKQNSLLNIHESSSTKKTLKTRIQSNEGEISLNDSNASMSEQQKFEEECKTNKDTVAENSISKREHFILHKDYSKRSMFDSWLTTGCYTSISNKPQFFVGKENNSLFGEYSMSENGIRIDLMDAQSNERGTVFHSQFSNERSTVFPTQCSSERGTVSQFFVERENDSLLGEYSVSKSRNRVDLVDTQSTERGDSNSCISDSPKQSYDGGTQNLLVSDKNVAGDVIGPPKKTKFRKSLMEVYNLILERCH